MKKYVTAFMAVMLLALAGTLNAEALYAHMVRATIPFAFSAGSQAMPAGDYTVSVDQQSGRILLEGPSSYTLMTVPKETQEVPSRGRLVFQQDGATFFLTEVWTPENSTGQVLVHKGKDEASHAKQAKHTLQIEAR